MTKLTVRPLQIGDVERIAANLRDVDAAEIYATNGRTDIDAVLYDGVKVSSLIWTIDIDGVPAGLFGVAPTAAHAIGVPWMLGTPALERAPGQLTKKGRVYVARMREAYPTLINFVDARATKSIGWLRLLGFTIAEKPEPFGIFKMPFYRFGVN